VLVLVVLNTYYVVSWSLLGKCSDRLLICKTDDLFYIDRSNLVRVLQKRKTDAASAMRRLAYIPTPFGKLTIAQTNL